MSVLDGRSSGLDATDLRSLLDELDWWSGLDLLLYRERDVEVSGELYVKWDFSESEPLSESFRPPPLVGGVRTLTIGFEFGTLTCWAS